MVALLTILRDICLFRAGPQDLPHSSRITTNLVLCLVALGVTASALQGVTGAQMLPRALLSLGFVVLVPRLLLGLRGLGARHLQTVAAIAGTGVLYALLTLPLFAVLAGGVPAQGNPLLSLLAMVVVVLTLWRLLVSAHIWRHALALPPAGGVLVAVGLFIAQLLLARWLFMPPA